MQTGIATDSDLTAFGRDLGTGTAFPTQGPAASALRRGDVYFHATYGALFLWNGTGWRARGPGELTATQRTALVAANIPYAGFQVYETDTGSLWQWNGTAWADPNALPVCQVRQTTAQSIAASAWVPLTFQTVDYDPDGLYAGTATDRITIKRKGMYRLGGSAQFPAPATVSRIGAQLTKGGAYLAAGTECLASTAAGGTSTGVVIPPILAQLNAGDYVGLNALQATGATINTIATVDSFSMLNVECVRLLP